MRTLLKKVNAWKMWVLCDRPAIKNWTKGRITLLGDAAHPMLQYLAQGGNTAMEDAVCLANQVEATGRDYGAAFQKYQELRYLRTARVQLMARVFGEIYHASGVNRELRNKLLREWGRRAASTCRGSMAISLSCHASKTCRCRRRRGSILTTIQIIREENRSWRNSTI